MLFLLLYLLFLLTRLRTPKHHAIEGRNDPSKNTLPRGLTSLLNPVKNKTGSYIKT